jgi:hypothetical protein
MGVYSTCWQQYAAKRFPRSTRFIYGDGRFALISRCRVPWRILLFSDTCSRQAKLDQWTTANCCNALDCFGEHEVTDLDRD